MDNFVQSQHKIEELETFSCAFKKNSNLLFVCKALTVSSIPVFLYGE